MRIVVYQSGLQYGECSVSVRTNMQVMKHILPEDSERERPQHQWFPQLKLFPLFHHMSAA